MDFAVNELTDAAGVARLLKTTEAAYYVGLNEGSLANMRSRGVGPAWVKLGSSVRYRQQDLDAWISANLVEAGIR
jgi:predicted DNA-binding transcriptional regulator AlpA